MTHVAIIPSRQQNSRIIRYGTSVLERDSREAPSVIAHTLQGVAAIAEEILWRGQRVVAGRLGRNADVADTVRQVAREVEQKMAGTRSGAEEGGVAVVLREERRWELRTDLVGVAADAGTDRRADLLALRAELLHRHDRGLGDAVQRAFPTGVRCADHAGGGIGEEHRRAVGRHRA